MIKSKDIDWVINEKNHGHADMREVCGKLNLQL